MASRARQLQSCQLAVCRSRIHIGPSIQKLGRRLGSVHEAGHMQRRPALGILRILIDSSISMVGDQSCQGIEVVLVAGLVVFRAVPSLRNYLLLFALTESIEVIKISESI